MEDTKKELDKAAEEAKAAEKAAKEAEKKATEEAKAAENKAAKEANAEGKISDNTATVAGAAGAAARERQRAEQAYGEHGCDFPSHLVPPLLPVHRPGEVVGIAKGRPHGTPALHLPSHVRDLVEHNDHLCGVVVNNIHNHRLVFRS